MTLSLDHLGCVAADRAGGTQNGDRFHRNRYQINTYGDIVIRTSFAMPAAKIDGSEFFGDFFADPTL